MKIYTKQSVNASAETMWQIVGQQFASVADWASSLDHKGERS